MLILDLGVFHRKSEEISVKQALLWTGLWVLLRCQALKSILPTWSMD
jgi:hypothetical protein